MSFTKMKIRTPTKQSAIDVQQALYDIGYKWHEFVVDKGHYKFVDDCYSMHTDVDGILVRMSLSGKNLAEEFANEEEDEFVLVGGEFLLVADYFKQPVTAKPATEKTYEPLPEALQEIVTVETKAFSMQDALGKVVLAACGTLNGNITAKPVFHSRTEHERLRIIALAEQIASLASAKDSVPREYAQELDALVARAANRENIDEDDF